MTVEEPELFFVPMKEPLEEEDMDLARIRHDLHEIPEIGFNEFKTQAYIMSFLDRLSLSYEKVAGHRNPGEMEKRLKVFRSISSRYGCSSCFRRDRCPVQICT